MQCISSSAWYIIKDATACMAGIIGEGGELNIPFTQASSFT